jgi:hypothetical protein
VVKILKLSRPNKRSGFELASGETTEIRGVTIVNRNKFSIFIDKFTPHYKKRK